MIARVFPHSPRPSHPLCQQRQLGEPSGEVLWPGWAVCATRLESCFAGATWGRVGITPWAENAYLLSWEKGTISSPTMVLSEGQCPPSPPTAEGAPGHAITKAGISKPSQHSAHTMGTRRGHIPTQMDRAVPIYITFQC